MKKELIRRVKEANERERLYLLSEGHLLRQENHDEPSELNEPGGAAVLGSGMTGKAG